MNEQIARIYEKMLAENGKVEEVVQEGNKYKITVSAPGRRASDPPGHRYYATYELEPEDGS